MPHSENHQPDSLDIKLSRSEEKYNMLFEYSPFGMAMINHNTGDFHEVNRSLLEMTGYTKEEFLKLSFWDITPSEYQEQEEQQKLDLEATGRFGPNEKEYIRKDGSRFPIRIKGFILEDVDGTRLVWGIIEDISNEYRRIFDDLQDAYVQIDLSDHLMMVNKVTVKMFGYTTADEIIGTNLQALFADPRDFAKMIAAVRLKTSLSCYVFNGVRKDGSRLWVSLNVQQVRNRHGAMVAIEGVMRDITDIKEMETALKESEELFRGIVQSISDMVYTLDTEQRHTGVYGNWFKKSNLTEAFFLGKTAADVFGPEQQQIHGEPTSRALAGENVIYEWALDTGEEPLYFQTSLSPLHDGSGNITGVVGVGRDVSTIKTTKKKLIKSLMKNQTIIENLQDAYFQTDLAEKIVFVNPTAMTMFGGNQLDDLIGRQVTSLYVEPDARVDLYQKLNATGKVKDFITKGFRVNGSVFWASINAQFTHNEDGVIVGVEGVVRDVSERVLLSEKLEQQRNQLAKRLEQSVNTISKIGELRDPYTAGHQKRVAELACAIAAALGLSDDAIHNIKVGGLIHDIGKIFIATDILNKPGKITDLEYQIIQTHAEHGYHIASNIDFPAEIPTMIYQHHEYLDGTGYPNGLAGDQILIESRILTVADIVEAITSHRPYRPSLGLEVAFAEISRYRGTKFDEDVVDACLRLFKTEGFVFSPE